MTGIVHAAVTLGGALAAWVFGRRLGSRSGCAWLWVYAAGLLLALSIGLGRRFPWLEFHPPVSWMMAGRTEYALIGPITALLLGVTVPRLPRVRDRRAVTGLAIAVILAESALPFALPAIAAPRLARLTTTRDSHGTCRQSTDYTCGPAAAVTALTKLGFHAEEGELARAAGTDPLTGTQPDLMARALREKFGPMGLQVDYRAFVSLEEIPRNNPAILLIKLSWWIDHYVTVLEAGNGEFLVADPLEGLSLWTRADLERRWRAVGIALARSPLPPRAHESNPLP
ncbi:MAG TPA: cysteine peptidase family C39 domain-containing protein [Candidatus Paceibacterota bacterium]|nr:cysteine peptidase family C39 domain-containing protein [Verrucomicrobiota bacterium]HRZ45885.1 cysteine peptidase family C39 domain-containing protein [Candidatus Paceibacterota bacterium]HRZ93118.1 cysteine peptidase family C39 domain-containing protein [Candidatus Paceibacterota bacterium]